MATMNGIWSPLGEAAQKQQQQQLLDSLLASPFVQRLRQCQEDEQRTLGQLMWRIHEIEEEAKAYIAADNMRRVEKLKLELASICQQGRAAQAELQAAKDNEIVIRNEDATRNNRYNNAARTLGNARNVTLPQFYSDRDVAAKNKEIECAQTEVDAALADLQLHPLAIPQAARNVRQAELKVADFAAKERELRNQIIALDGQQSQPEGTTDNGLGLR